MIKVVFLQLGAILVASALSAVFFGVHGAVSAMIAGLACALPNAVFALRLGLVNRRSGAVSAVTFIVGEFVKLVTMVGLLVLAWAVYADLNWWGLLIGLVLALKANLFALLVKT